MNSVNRAMVNLLSSDVLNKYLSEDKRATILSINSSFKALLAALLLWVFGIIIRYSDLQTALLGLGIFSIFGGIIFFYSYKRVFGKV